MRKLDGESKRLTVIICVFAHRLGPQIRGLDQVLADLVSQVVSEIAALVVVLWILPLGHTNRVIVRTSIRKRRSLAVHLAQFAMLYQFEHDHRLLRRRYYLNEIQQLVPDALVEFRGEGNSACSPSDYLPAAIARGLAQQGIDFAVRHRTEIVEQGAGLEQRTKDLLAVDTETVVEPRGHEHGTGSMGRGGEAKVERSIRVGCEGKIVCKLHNRGESVERERRHAGPHGLPLLVGTVGEFDDGAETGSRPAEGPEEVWVFVRRGGHDLRIRRDQFSGEEVVNDQTIAAGQVTVAAAESEASDAGVIYGATNGSETVVAGRFVDVFPEAAAFGRDGHVGRIHGDAVHL